MTLLFTLLFSIPIVFVVLVTYRDRHLDVGGLALLGFCTILLYFLLFVPVRQYECGNPCPVGYERGIDNLLP